MEEEKRDDKVPPTIPIVIIALCVVAVLVARGHDRRHANRYPYSR